MIIPTIETGLVRDSYSKAIFINNEKDKHLFRQKVLAKQKIETIDRELHLLKQTTTEDMKSIKSELSEIRYLISHMFVSSQCKS